MSSFSPGLAASFGRRRPDPDDPGFDVDALAQGDQATAVALAARESTPESDAWEVARASRAIAEGAVQAGGGAAGARKLAKLS